MSVHPEIAEAHWSLSGHFVGAYWTSIMQAMYPERIVAIWFRSGTAFEYWERGETVRPDFRDGAMGIPMMCNPGVKENGSPIPNQNRAWTGALAVFKAYRAAGAPIGFAPDPNTGHECGDFRYLAIPFFDACLKLRLSGRTGGPLKPVGLRQGWLAPLFGDDAKRFDRFAGPAAEAVWLPSAAFARAWTQYVRTGDVEDATPPPAPNRLRIVSGPQGFTLTWDADVDLESGLRAFVVVRDGIEIARIPQNPTNQFGRLVFQGMSYGDTPVEPIPDFSFTDKLPKAGEHHEYRIIAINTVGLRSKASPPACVQ